MTDSERARIDRINEISAIARTSWLALLGHLAFIGISLLAVEDADFFVETLRTDLPLVGVAVPTYAFFLFAPLLAAAGLPVALDAGARRGPDPRHRRRPARRHSRRPDRLLDAARSLAHPRLHECPWRGWWRRPTGIATALAVVVVSWLRTEGGDAVFGTALLEECALRAGNGRQLSGHPHG